MSIEEGLIDFTADLVSEAKNREFLKRLFALSSGEWANFSTLADDDICNQLGLLDQSLPDGLRVTWLDLPNSLHGRGFCLVIFYAEAIFWSNVILYNRELFISRR